MRLIPKLFLLILMVSFFFSISFKSISQRPFKSISNPPNNFDFKAVTDTLLPISFLNGTLTLDTALAGGYVCGTNAYNDIAKAQIYFIEDSLSYYVSGCGLYVGDLQVSDSSKNLTVNLYDLFGMGYNTDSLLYYNVPGNVIGTVEVPVNALVENQINYIYFQNEMWVLGGYALGIDFTNFGTNQIGLISTSDGDAQQKELAWEKLNNWQWYSMLSTWPFDGDLGIFSLINGVNAGLVNNNVSLSTFNIYPNPVLNNSFSIECISTFESMAKIKIFDTRGALVLEKDLFLNAGKNVVSFNLPKLKNGNYFISVKTSNNNFIKKVTLN